MLAIVWGVWDGVGVQGTVVLADSAYGTGALRAELEDRGMRAVRLGQSRTQRLRHCLLHTAARITHTGRQHIAKLADDWPWTRHLITAFQHVHNLPRGRPVAWWTLGSSLGD